MQIPLTSLIHEIVHTHLAFLQMYALTRRCLYKRLWIILHKFIRSIRGKKKIKELPLTEHLLLAQHNAKSFVYSISIISFELSTIYRSGLKNLNEWKSCLDICLGVGLLDHKIFPYLVFWGNSILFSIVVIPFFHILSSICYL